MSRPRVVVVGAGLAGLTAALDCSDAGAEVTVVERRGRLGGLTWSFSHDDHWVDNGQHVFLRCCDAYLEFLERIGSRGDVTLQRRLDVQVLDPEVLDARGNPRVARLRRNGLPAPLHLGPALLRYRHLPLADRLRLGRAALPLRGVRLDDPALDRVTFAEWLGSRGQSPDAIRALWDLITVATINLPAVEASAAMGAKVFQTGLLTDAAAADIGWSNIPLGRLHGERAAAALDRAGAKVLTGCRVDRVRVAESPYGAGVEVTVEGDSTLEADAAVVAVPHQVLGQVLEPGITSGATDPGAMGTSAIVNVHVVYDRPVTDLALAASVRGPVHWVFDRTVSSGLEPDTSPVAGRPGAARPAQLGRHGPPGSGWVPTGPNRRQYLAVTLSAADALLGRPPSEVADSITEALRSLFPAARHAQVLDALVTKERTATFRAAPGSAAHRPGPLTSVPGVVVAGAWTDTGWPATMEGAVRSGHAAARAALVAAGVGRRLPEEVG